MQYIFLKPLPTSYRSVTLPKGEGIGSTKCNFSKQFLNRPECISHLLPLCQQLAQDFGISGRS